MADLNFYTVGGSVQAGGGLYIPRRADAELLRLCREGTFAYVLTPRQLGKSSLMVRTAEQLAAEGARTAIIDLTQIGVQVSAEEWYLGLLATIEEQLTLETDVVGWWQANAELGMTQRLTRFFREVLLTEIAGRIIIFVDEIDTTLSLPFTDDFYAAIRYLYHARAHDPEFRRLSCVLIGVATPGDLMRDPQRTPFNIGQRVDLTDFTAEEALPLADGLGLPPDEARVALGWAMEWTGGHPYLTQRLCREMAAEGRARWTRQDVAQAVERTFLGEMSEQDNNLQFVRDMLTKRAPDPAETLVTYRDVRRGVAVADDERSLVKSHLKLSGIVRREVGALRVRNRIYREVFDGRWIKEHLPATWTKRQFVRLQRVAAVLVAGFILVGGLAAFALAQRREAVEQRRAAVARAAELERTLRVLEKQERDANELRRAADERRDEAERQKQIVEWQNKEIDRERKRAEEQKAIADEQRHRAEEQATRAVALNEQLSAALKAATRERERAEAAQKVAEERRQEADQQRAVAERERARAEKDEADTLAAINGFSASEKQKALDYYMQTLRHRRFSGDRSGEAATLNIVGLVLNSLGDRQRALEHLNAALKHRQELEDSSGEARTLNNIGTVYQARGEQSKAIDYFQSALLIFRNLNERTGQALTLSNLAAAHFNSGKRQEAIALYSQAAALFRATENRSGEAEALYRLGEVYAAAGAQETEAERREALSFYNNALTLHQAAGNRQGEVNTLYTLMSFWKTRGNPSVAIFYGKQAVNALQESRSTIRGLGQELQSSFLKANENTYRELADSLITANRLTEAQQVLGMLRQEEVGELARLADEGQPPTTEVAARTPQEVESERRYKEIADSVISIGEKRRELLSKDSRSLEEDRLLAQLESDLSAAQQAFNRFLNQLAGELSEGRGADRVYELRDVGGMQASLRELGPGVIALYTLVGKDKYRVVLVTPNAQKVAEYPIKAADLNRKVLEFRAVLQQPRVDPRPLARELYEILIGPVARDLEAARAETLMWSLDGSLRYIPMAALHDGERYMVERYRNVNFNSATLPWLKDAPSAKWSGLGMGTTQPLSSENYSFPAMPYVAKELQIFGGLLAPIPGKRLMDAAFTREAMLSELRRGYQVVHIAGVFSLRPTIEESFLLLGDSSRLTLSEMKDLPSLFMGVELLTLSGSDTYLGGEGPDGREIEGFAVLAQRQGAKAVLASLWNVSDESTATLMQEFYGRRVRSGLTKAEALRRAQLSLLGQQRFEHPYFWAPFVLSGNWK